MVDMAADQFENEVNPSGEEIRRWAYSDAVEPMQDWQLIIGQSEHAETLIDLVSDPACPAREYLLSALYLLVGDSVRTDYHTTSRDELDRLLAAADSIGDRWLSTWVSRSRRLMEMPSGFVYAAWCGGGLASTPVTA
jgi:hypothetical protein